MEEKGAIGTPPPQVHPYFTYWAGEGRKKKLRISDCGLPFESLRALSMVEVPKSAIFSSFHPPPHR